MHCNFFLEIKLGRVIWILKKKKFKILSCHFFFLIEKRTQKSHSLKRQYIYPFLPPKSPNTATALFIQKIEMLSCPLHQHSHSLLLHHRPNTTISSSLRRTHNSKSTSLLLRHLSQPQPQPQPQDHAAPAPTPLDEKEKVELLELSLVTKRTPQFPGSIYVQSPSDPDVHTSLPPLQTLFQTQTNNGDEEDEEEDHDLIMRALEIRRKVTAEIFKESMIRKGKFGITYATNLTRRLSDFIDYVMVEAAAMKRLPDFSESTFNFRAKTVIDDSRVVPLIR